MAALRSNINVAVGLKNRAKDLLQGITNLLQDKTLVKELYNHPLIYALYDGEFTEKVGTKGEATRINTGKLPSYIPSRTFALGLLGVLGVEGTNATNPVQDLRAILNKISVDNTESKGLREVKKALLAMVDDAQGDINRLRTGIENWYDGTMDRVSGWYKRRVQWIIFALGLVAAVVLNIDTIYIAKTLLTDVPLRHSLVAAAQEYAKGDAARPDEQAKQRLENNLNLIQQLGLPIGWSKIKMSSDTLLHRRSEQNKISMIFGWLFTGFAVSFGAPFWFDLLNKIMVIRSTVKPHEKSPEEASEDRQSGKRTQNSHDG